MMFNSAAKQQIDMLYTGRKDVKQLGFAILKTL